MVLPADNSATYRSPVPLLSSSRGTRQSSRDTWQVGWNTWSRDKRPTFSRWRRCWRSLHRCFTPSMYAPPTPGHERCTAGHYGGTTLGDIFSVRPTF
jgi:hypothetical protein